MLTSILLNLVSSLIMYIVVNTITSQSQTETQNYFKDQLEQLRSVIVNSGIQQQQNMMNEVKQSQINIMNEVKQSQANMLNEIKEAAQNLGKEE